MFYLDGDNKLSTALQQTLDTIISIGSTDEVKFAVLIDGNKDSDTKLYYVIDKSIHEQDWPIESDMTDPQTIINFVNKVKNDYPARHYGLTITSNKGSGWQGICWDNHGDGIMITMPELLDTLKNVTNNGDKKISLLLIESCLCSNLEVRYQIRSYCDFIVGYADCGLVGDIPYEESLSALVNNPSMSPRELVLFIVNRFNPQDLPLYKIKQSFGAMNSSRLDELGIAIDDLALFFIENLDEFREDIESALANTRKYGITWNIDYFIDLAHFLELLTIDNTEFINIKNNVLDKINNAVIAKAVLEDDHSCGFNFYFPGLKSDYNHALRYENGRLPSPYEETFFAMETNWDEFLKNYLGLIDNSSPNIPDLSGPSKGKVGEEYTFTVSAVDPDGDNVYLFVEYCDSSNTGWIGPYGSGEELIFSHTWETEGTKLIKAKAEDIYHADSEWATLEISMPKHRLYKPITQFYERIIERLNLLENIIKYIINE